MVVQTQTNRNSIISLTVGILSIVIPIIGLVLGIVGVVLSRKALKEIGNAYGSGKGLATSGLICSVVGVITQLFGVLGFIPFFNLTTTSF